MKLTAVSAALALLAVSSTPLLAGDWNSLAGISKTRTVTVHLKDGQKTEGTIQQVDAESLQLAPKAKRISVRVKELESAVDETQVGKIVELAGRGGRSFKGTLIDANSSYVHLDESSSAVRISRVAVRKVTYCSRALGALAGLGVGAGLGALVGAKVNLIRDTGVTRGESAGFGGTLFGLIGAVMGAAAGVERTPYSSADSRAANPVAVSGSASVTSTRFLYDPVTQRYTGSLTVKNTVSSAIGAPVQVLLTGLPASVTLANSSGSWKGSPYVTLPGNAALNPGQSASVELQFTNPAGEEIKFTSVVYSGVLQ
jgi:hypothetical protein